MPFDLCIISKLSSEIINTCDIGIVQEGVPDIGDLYNEIYKLSKSLDMDDYQLYWRYSMETYFPISDFMSYFTAVTLSGERKIYMLMDDYGEIWEDNISFLEDLDGQELAEQRERERDIYDVRMPCQMPDDSSADRRSSVAPSGAEAAQPPREPRSNLDILTYSLRKMPQPKFLQNDLTSKCNFMEVLKLGYPKRKPRDAPVEVDIPFRPIASKAQSKKAGSKKSIKSKSKSGGKKGGSKGKKSPK